MSSTNVYSSSIAWINLNDGTVRVRPQEATLSHLFVGGRGVGLAALFRHLADPATPLAPENPLIFSIGPLTGTPWPAGARYHVTFHSPLTGIYGYANAGGFFGSALRRAGYETLVVTGRAEQPVYLEVTPEGIAIRPADHLWGLDTGTTHETLATQGARVACIGPAGECGVRFAAIINDGGRAAARCGGGAVMGSKNLKAIVVRGQRPLDLPAEFRALARSAFEQVRDHPAVTGLRDWGTVSLVANKNYTGDLPTRNHQLGQVAWADMVDARAIARYTRRTKGCFACPIRCGRVTRIESGPYAGDLEGPEYETLDALGPLCWINDPEVIIHANRLCNDLGLDTISTGVVVAFAMECHQRGLLDDPDISLEWGDVDTLLGLIERIAHRRGLGNLLAEGVHRAAETIGGDAPRYAMHVKGMELPRQEPRIAKGFGLGHATSNRGADHLYALPTIDLAGNLDTARRFFPPEIIPTMMEPDDETYKPDLIVFTEHYCALSDALGVCKFTTAETYAVYPDDLAAGLSALWGREVSGEELLTAGERIVNLERLYNVQLGLSRADDRLPSRFIDEPLEVRAFDRDDETGEVQPAPEPMHIGHLRDFEAMLDRYYRLRGWDESGIPSLETLRRLRLERWTSSSVTGR
ncbi:MAG: aldehyde ferredoxin oxidoreductase family protein [Chloroflexota bacterium]|nr:aldehyde ferredoxin oxidoreductase family protein [Chloroflexota bacterium]